MYYKANKSSLGAGKADIRIAHTPNELQIALATIESDTIQIQEFILKD